MQFSPKELKQKLSEGLDDDYNVRTSDKKRKITVFVVPVQTSLFGHVWPTRRALAVEKSSHENLLLGLFYGAKVVGK